MPKTLYVADLDGTLLDRGGSLSEYTIQTVRRMHDEGRLFTIATARSLQSANDLLWYLGIRLPVILANGAAIFDSVEQKYLHVTAISLDALPKILWTIESHHICAFLYAIQNGQMSMYYRTIWQNWDTIYHAARVERYQGRIFQVENLLAVAQEFPPAYLVACGPIEILAEVREELERIPGILCQIYNDLYNNFYFIEIFSAAASKAVAMLELQKLTGAEELVAFGDNYTDLQMLLAADRSYVPKNAVYAARNLANGVLDSADRDGVARFLSQEFGWESERADGLDKAE